MCVFFFFHSPPVPPAAVCSFRTAYPIAASPPTNDSAGGGPSRAGRHLPAAGARATCGAGRGGGVVGGADPTTPTSRRSRRVQFNVRRRSRSWLCAPATSDASAAAVVDPSVTRLSVATKRIRAFFRIFRRLVFLHGFRIVSSPPPSSSSRFVVRADSRVRRRWCFSVFRARAPHERRRGPSRDARNDRGRTANRRRKVLLDRGHVPSSRQHRTRHAKRKYDDYIVSSDPQTSSPPRATPSVPVFRRPLKLLRRAVCSENYYLFVKKNSRNKYTQ